MSRQTQSAQLRRHRARVLAAAACVAVVATVLPGATRAASSAEPADIRDAKAQVTAMQSKVGAVAAELDRGTREYREGQRRLAAAHGQERAARRAAERLQTELSAQQKRLNAVAAAAFRRPMPNLLAAMAGGTDFAGALVAKADLEHVSGSQQDVLRDVAAARVRADSRRLEAEQLAAETRAVERRLGAQLQRLRDTAARAERELQAAATRLEEAQERERARLEAIEQARVAALERARAAAAQRAGELAAARQRLLRLARASSCRGEPSEGYANGFMPDGALCALWQAPGERLRQDAAAAFNRLSQSYAAQTGSPLCVTDSYRSYARQVDVYSRKPGLAATPGTSEHGWGKAVDLCGGVERFGSDAYQWMKANAGAFGFIHPEWAEPYGSMPEPWHWEFVR